MTKRAALYARVSTDGQATKGHSLQTQLDACREYAHRQGWAVAAEYADAASGTIPVQERPEGKRLYQDVASGKADSVVLYTIDRAARDEDVIEFLIFKRDMKAAGVELHFCDSGKTADDPIAGIVDYFKAAQASDERKKIKERSVRNTRAKAAKGWVGNRTPYGYRKVGLRSEARLVIDPEQAAIVKRIFAMYTGPEFLSMFAIAEKLTAEGAPTPKGAALWGHTTIRALVTQRLYIGEVKYSDVVITLPELAIIDRATFEAAKARMRKNKEQGRRNRKQDYLLAGFIRCYCGRAACRIEARDRQGKYTYYYYKCGGYKSGHEKKCDNYYLRDEIVEGLVWETVTRGLSREVLIEGITAQNKSKAAELAPKHERLASLDDIITRLDRKIKRYLNEFGEEDNKKLAAEAKELANSTAGQREKFVEERRRLELELKEHAFTEAQQSAILARAEVLHRKVTTGKPTLAQKREFLRTLDLEVTIVEGHQKMTVSWILGKEVLPIEYTGDTSHAHPGK